MNIGEVPANMVFIGDNEHNGFMAVKIGKKNYFVLGAKSDTKKDYQDSYGVASGIGNAGLERKAVVLCDMRQIRELLYDYADVKDIILS